jgi:hypothetical protein
VPIFFLTTTPWLWVYVLFESIVKFLTLLKQKTGHGSFPWPVKCSWESAGVLQGALCQTVSQMY